jgi:glyoxylase-like metal-dependent hydrolase (beta-lactamase superfamily II)
VANASARAPVEIKVHTGHGVNGYDVNSTMISGAHDMIVIDPQFSLSEAHRLAAEILESKQNLTTIYISHPHPDHLFGLAVLKQAFPNARAVALPATRGVVMLLPRYLSVRSSESSPNTLSTLGRLTGTSMA